MKVELWGTFSVKDHLRARAFVADVLLYDRLVIPRPPALSEEPGEDARTSWRREGWDPDRLAELLEILGEARLAVEIPWGKQARTQWHQLMTAPDQLGAKRSELLDSVASQVKSAAPENAAYLATGGLLSMYVANQVQSEVARKLLALGRTPGVEVEPVVAYGSYHDFAQEQRVEAATGEAAPTTLNPYTLFGWEFFVPEDSGKTDHQLLRDAVRLAGRPDFRETRQAFHGWLKLMNEGGVDVETARREMLRMLHEYREFVRGSGLRTVVHYAAKVAAVLSPLGGLAGNEIGVGVGVGTAAASLLIERYVPKAEADARVRPAALVHQAARFFGRAIPSS